MSSDTMITVAVDAMGGDRGPEVILSGVREALAEDPSLRIVVVGLQEVVGDLIDAQSRLSAVLATQVIEMDEHPAKVVKSRPDSSMVVGCRLLKEGTAKAFLTTGNTGAALAASLLTLGRIKGVKRPALATVVPGTERACVLLDIGANADCKPEHIVHFAHMGRAYSTATLGVEDPTVGLLNIGEEPSKGSRSALEAHGLLAKVIPAFRGNVEGRDIPRAPVDVIVTDGFTGNVAIKLLEGLAATIMSEVAAALTTNVASTLASAVVKPHLREMKHRLDPEQYGGAPLLGVNGVCIVGHGNSTERAVASGIRVAARAARQDLTGRISEAIS